MVTIKSVLPSKNSSNYQEMEDQYEMDIFPRRPITIVRGNGIYLWDVNDKRYFDCVSGWGSANIGHGNPIIAKALYNQANTLISCPGIFYNDIRAKLSQKIIDITPKGLNRVFYQNSGTETIEAALKFAMLTTGKFKFISMMRSFHGRSLGALSVTFNQKYKKDFSAFLGTGNVEFTPLNNLDKLKNIISDEIAAIIIEPVQGEGGVNIASDEFLRDVKKLCDENNIILIVDEVQTGFGRTGFMFAIESSGIIPDILCLAKSIAGGLPMGAVVVSDKIHVAKGKHGTTFGGNPLACAAAIANIDFINSNNLIENSQTQGEYFISKLRENLLEIPNVRNIRSKGLFIGIEMKHDIRPLVDKLMDNGLLVIPTGKTVIRLLPPIIISQDEIDKIIEILVLVLND